MGTTTRSPINPPGLPPGHYGSSSANGLTVDAAGNTWVVEGSGYLGRHDATGKWHQYVVAPDYDSGEQITIAKDGTLWATYGTDVVHVSPTGQLLRRIPAEASCTDQSCYTEAITQGADGRIWFTTFGSDIGAISATGAVSHYPVTLPKSLEDFVQWSRPAMVAGPDHNLWISEPNASSVFRVSTSGAVVSIVTIHNGSPTGLTLGPDGRIWAATGTALARIATDGTYQWIRPAIVAGGGYLDTVTTGPDRNVWWLFRPVGTNRLVVGRTTTAGTTTEFPQPSSGFITPNLARGASTVQFTDDSNLYVTVAK